MKTNRTPCPHTTRATLALTSVAVAALLAACGGGDGVDEAPQAAGPQAQAQDLATEAAVEAPTVSPTYHLANVLPPEPSEIDADGSNASALQQPTQAALRDDLAGLSTAGTTGEELRRRVQAAPRAGADGHGAAAPMAGSTGTVTYYTPAQIRTAYGLDKLPASSTTNKGAYQGSGQTIVIVGAFHNSTVAADLAAFNTRFGLPACTTVNIAATTALPLAKAAPGSGCTISVVYATSAGGLTTKVPAANSGWATESALDVQWAHAIAPMARIILVEAASAGSNDLTGAVTLAGKLGSTVSMSWGAPEFNGQGTLDKYFTTTGVTYLAASGDNGRGVSWPAVSPNVVAVGGTKLAASGSTRAETAWTGSGGGLSAYTAAPAWQSTIKVTATNGVRAAPSKRAVPDVAFNADPNSGQLVYSKAAGGWVVAGGTSISTPQWAGLVAITNAVRALNGKAALVGTSNLVYRNIGAVATSYSSNLLDVISGANGSCNGCAAMSGYDQVTGLGTPQADKVVGVMAAW
jgi:subtilase family serine protease